MKSTTSAPPAPSVRRPVVFTLRIDPETLRWGDADLGGPAARLLALAHALSASPLWSEMPNARVVVRLGPRPLLGVIASVDDGTAARVEALSWQLKDALGRLRYVSYAQAEKDCERLAALLLERFGRDALDAATFAAIPRGGLIVLGMLSYLLGLRPEQLEAKAAAGATLVAVDDCALSGARFRGFLRRCGDRRVIFAHLYSHPALRAAIEAEEPAVAACVAARDLTDHAAARLGDGYEAWRDRWRARPDDGYWIGQPEHVCFAWSEPDITIWNPVTERAEAGWRVVPPELCLKNRSRPGSEARVRVVVQAEGKGPLRPAPAVLFGEWEERIIVANPATSVSVELADSAADLWRAIVEHGEPAVAARALAEVYAVDEPRLRADVERLTDRLLALGLLEVVGANDDG